MSNSDNYLKVECHSYRIDDAKKYGVNEAVILNNIRFWINKNKLDYLVNKRESIHVHNGRVWTFNSYRAFSIVLPEFTEKQIRTAIDHLSREGILIKGNYNKLKSDATWWYTINEDWTKVDDWCPTGQSICPESQIPSALEGKRSDPEGKPLPDINSDINTNINTEKGCETSQPTEPPTKGYKKQIQEYWNLKIKGTPLSKCRVLSPTRLDNIANLNKQLSFNGSIDAWKEFIDKIFESSFLQGDNERQWVADFDWVLETKNAIKIIEGKYNKKNILTKRDKALQEITEVEERRRQEILAERSTQYQGGRA